MRMLLKRIPKKSWPMILVIGMACVLLYTIYLRFNATSIGGSLGGGLGAAAGRAVGSFEGITTGSREGFAEGKAAGLSAEDTAASIENEITQLEKLRVLVASVKLSNFHEIGEEKAFSAYYAVLYLVNGNVVFTVDMAQAQVTSTGSDLNIILPKPEGELKLDNRSVEKAAEYQTTLFNGNAEDGFDTYLNTMTKVQEASDKTLDNYDVLIKSAKEAAERQVTRLVRATSNQYSNVNISFAD